MPDNQTTDQTSVQAPESPADGQTATPEGGSTGEPQKLNKEARYRVERNEAREALAVSEARVAQLQRAEVERLAGESLAMPGDLFSLSGNELADYLGDDGTVDPEKVAADVAAILAERPGLQKQTHPVGYDPSQGRGGRPPKAPTPTLAHLIKSATQGAQHWGAPPRK